jgi:hypothetical protein
MSREESALFEAVAGKQIRRLNYSVTSLDGIGYGKLGTSALLQVPGFLVGAMTRKSFE